MEVLPKSSTSLSRVKGCLSAAAGLFNAAPGSCLPSRMDTVTDLNSGCVQPSSVGNPVLYSSHLAFLLHVSSKISYTHTPTFHNPKKYKHAYHLTHICLNSRYHLLFWLFFCFFVFDIMRQPAPGLRYFAIQRNRWHLLLQIMADMKINLIITHCRTASQWPPL